ncbi:virion component [Staphylococcus phage Twort]|uniref:Virion component n=2 Tax=Staphylococcus phage Twort (strain DSM 17442 / HER 48) TaxID=2908167 RepID=A0A6H0X5B3_BPTWO|nr:virion structural protein [Staphylococcus phage Twort]AAX92414.1 ORF125 [Staphylococcus phage Twort]QIW89109.1 virion component [Staphylococcus phage Twort]
MNKKQEVLESMKKELGCLPPSVSMTSKYDALHIHGALEKFKELSDTGSKLTKKYLNGSEILTINYQDFDSMQDYYLYLLRNYSKIKQCLGEITEHFEQRIA